MLKIIKQDSFFSLLSKRRFNEYYVTQVEITISGRNINHLRYADDTTLMAESEEKMTAPW